MLVRIGGVHASEEEIGFHLNWVDNRGYFGEISFWQHEDGIIEIDSETLSKEDIMEIFKALLDNAIIK